MGLIQYLKEKREKKLMNSRRMSLDESPKTIENALDGSFHDKETAKIFIAKFEEACKTNGVNADMVFSKFKFKGMQKPSTKIEIGQSKEIVKKFFYDFYPDFGIAAEEVMNNNAETSRKRVINFKIEKNEKCGTFVPSDPKEPVAVRVPVHGDLRDIYNMVSCIARTFDVDNGNSLSRRIFGETGVQALERLLDEYLMNESSIAKDPKAKLILEKDILEHRMSTFYDRYSSAKVLGLQEGDKRINSACAMYAQILQPQFKRKKQEDRKLDIIDVIGDVIDNEYDRICEGFDYDVRSKMEVPTLIDYACSEFFEDKDKLDKVDKELALVRYNENMKKISTPAKSKILIEYDQEKVVKIDDFRKRESQDEHFGNDDK